ncbi:nitronate monooxygenase [Rhodobacteraceae bacterium CH30]|nr:nitronate monooxygenase [Rhodobacteraceae bacterium CH30]
MSLLDTDITRLLGCRYPIIQTAMGWVADARLVAATGNAGGFGFLAAATLRPEAVEPEILRVKALSDAPFGINFHLFQPNADEIIGLAIKHGLKAVSYGRGPDKAQIKRLKDAGILCIPTVGALKHAQKAIALGADAVTIQGGEGGGHTGSVPTTILLPQVLDAVKVPVLAAGGFHDGRGLAMALAAGAAGIAMGTRFLMTSDSPVPAATLQQYVAVDDVAKIEVSLAVDGMRHRLIRNPVLEKLEQASPLGRLWLAIKSAHRFQNETGMSNAHMIKTLLRALKEDPAALSQTVMAASQPMLLQRSMVDGVPDEGLLASGQVAAAIDELISCETLIAGIVAEAEALLSRFAQPPQYPESKACQAGCVG